MWHCFSAHLFRFLPKNMSDGEASSLIFGSLRKCMGETLLSASAISKCGRKEGRREVAIGQGMCNTKWIWPKKNDFGWPSFGFRIGCPPSQLLCVCVGGVVGWLGGVSLHRRPSLRRRLSLQGWPLNTGTQSWAAACYNHQGRLQWQCIVSAGRGTGALFGRLARIQVVKPLSREGLWVMKIWCIFPTFITVTHPADSVHFFCTVYDQRWWRRVHTSGWHGQIKKTACNLDSLSQQKSGFIMFIVAIISHSAVTYCRSTATEARSLTLGLMPAAFNLLFFVLKRTQGIQKCNN